MPAKIVSIGDNKWKTADPVPETGVYRVLHSAHHLPDEVTLVKGKHFPRCEACDKPVTFRLLRRIDASTRFRIDLYQLPDLGERRAS